MNWFSNIHISLSGEPWMFVLGIIILMAYTLFVYRTTLPPINLLAKSLLVFLRTLALLLLLFLIFDPIIKITSSKQIEPENLIFFDNSKSIVQFSPSSEINKLNDLLKQFKNKLSGKSKFFTFGSELNEINISKTDSLNFNGISTNFNQLTKQIKKTNNISSLVIVSDGIINDGNNPQNELKEFGVPIYTIGLGDTTSSADLSIENIISNEFIYANRESEIEVILKNSNFANRIATVYYSIDSKTVETRNINLSPTGINRVKFPFISSAEGKHKISIRSFAGKNEKNKLNNNKSALIDVLATKKKLAIISGSPGRDLSLIVNSLLQNEDFELSKIIEITSDIYYNKEENIRLIDEADIIFLIGFPSEKSSPNFIKSLKELITKNKTPIFISLSQSTDYNKLKLLYPITPFNVGTISKKYREVQVQPNNFLIGLLGSSENSRNAWGNLPPISLNQTKIIPSLSSSTLLQNATNKMQPILFTNRLGNNKSIVITASNIWRWKLKSNDRELNLFDNLIQNSIKWLSVNNQNKFFDVKADKKNYLLAETITFTANLYDETLEPISNGEIRLEVLLNGQKQNIKFNPLGRGLYEAKVNVKNSGQLNYKASLTNNTRKLPEISGAINIEPIDLELVESKLNRNFLINVSINSNGKYFNIGDTDSLIDELNSNYQAKIHYKLIDKELRLSNFELILFFIVLLFSLEWAIRKVFSMI